GALVVAGEQDRGGTGHLGDLGDGGPGGRAGPVRDGEQRHRAGVNADYCGGLPGVFKRRDARGHLAVSLITRLIGEQAGRAADLDTPAADQGAHALAWGRGELLSAAEREPD